MTPRSADVLEGLTKRAERAELLAPQVASAEGPLRFAAGLGALGLLLSGIVIWFPELFGQGLRELSYVVHDIAFILFFAMIIGHIYLGTAAEPGTFGSMTRGTVTKEWARLHHPKWYREVTGNGRGR